MPAVQRADQVRRAARQGRGAGLRRSGDRALRAGRRGAGGPRAAPGRRHGEGPVLRARRARRRPAARARSSPWATRRSPRCARRPRHAGFAVARKPDSHDICFIPDGDTRAWLGRRLGDRPGELVDAAPARSSAPTPGPTGSPSASGAGSVSTGRRSTVSRATSWRSTPRATASSSARPTCSASTSSRATTCGGAARLRRRGERRRPGARARRGGAGDRRGRRRARWPPPTRRPPQAARAARPADPWGRARSVGRPLRGDAGRGVGDHQCDRPRLTDAAPGIRGSGSGVGRPWVPEAERRPATQRSARVARSTWCEPSQLLRPAASDTDQPRGIVD